MKFLSTLPGGSQLTHYNLLTLRVVIGADVIIQMITFQSQPYSMQIS